jgi:cysteine-rich repeat protein
MTAIPGRIGTQDETYAVRACGLVTMLLLTLTALPSEARLVTRIAPGGGATGGGFSASADGRYVAFATADVLVAGDTNGEADVFVLDRVSGLIERVSTHVDTSNGASNPYISADGRFVAFAAFDATFVGSFIDIFVYDRMTQATDRVSVSTGGAQADDSSSLNAISDDGRYVTFTSYATNLDVADQDPIVDLFIRDRVANTTEWLAKAYESDMSGNGRYVAYSLNAGGCFLLDRIASATTRIDLNSGGTPGNSLLVGSPSITSDGSLVAFSSIASNLVAGDTNGTYDVFLRDWQAGTTERVSVGAGGAQGNGHSGFSAYSSAAKVSNDGRYIVFASDSTSGLIGAPDINGGEDLFMRDRAADSTELITIGWKGDPAEVDELQGVYAIVDFSITGTSKDILFTSDSGNLIPDDVNGVRDLFVSSDCASVPTCGNGAIDDFRCEQCDDGNVSSGDGCTSLCLVEFCGDGTTQTALGEECDDLGTESGDGCDATCQEEFCGDGIVQTGLGEECEPTLHQGYCELDCLLANEGCPYNLCDCLGQAGNFAVLATKLKEKSAKFKIFGEQEVVGSLIDGSMCIETGKLAGIFEAQAEITGDLLFRTGSGEEAGKFKGYKAGDTVEAGVLLQGDLATAGGTLRGLDQVQVSGVTDLSGSYPGMSGCLAAPIDASSASASFAAMLPVQQTYGKFKTVEDVTLVAGPGITVFNFDSIALKSTAEDGEVYGAYLTIEQNPFSVAIILNVAKNVIVGTGGGIVTDGPPELVLLNVHGAKTKVKIGKEAFVDVPILAPNAKIKVGREAFVANILGGPLSLQGVEVVDELSCSEP